MEPQREGPAIEAEALTKTYGSQEAVRAVSFQVESGEFFGLLGPNGAGKSTTIGMLSGVIEPTRGRIAMGGDALGTRASRRKLGLVPQEFAFYPTLSARDNLNFFGRIYGLRGSRLDARVNAALDTVQLAGRAREPVTRFSNGMKRRLNIAIGLVHEPEILILDEPTVGVDAQSRNAIIEALEQLNREGVSVLYSTHYMVEAQRLCGRVAIMDHGRIIAMDSPRNLVRSLGEGVVHAEFSVPAPDAFIAELQRWGSVRVADDERRRIEVEAPAPDEALQRLLTLARDHDLAIRNLQRLEPNLETVFLRLTGRQLRD